MPAHGRRCPPRYAPPYIYIYIHAPPGEQRGLEDQRGQLFNELVRLLQVCQPKMFLFENVPGLAGSRDEADGPMQVMLRAFAAAGYDVTWHLVNARGWVHAWPRTVAMSG